MSNYQKNQSSTSEEKRHLGEKDRERKDQNINPGNERNKEKSDVKSPKKKEEDE